MHADPNFGNYLFREDGRLGLLDFGCVLRFEPEFIAPLRCIFSSTPSTAEDIVRLHGRLGVHYRNDVLSKERRDLLTEWGNWISEPYRTTSFDFGQSHDYFARGAAMNQKASRLLERCDGAFLYLGRAHHGLHRLLQALGATVRMNHC
jgi:predicted unusual protein kinase regulating ubiquinone biosynthesis (AarF/ABC1/UbiB family)